MAPGRTRLIWVTALTVASLLLGSGAINALAEGHGPHGGHADNDDHRQTTTTSTSTTSTSTATNTNGQTAGNVERKHGDDDEDLVTPPAQVTEEQRPGLGCGDGDDHSGAFGNPDNSCRHAHDNDSDMAGGTSGHDDNESASAMTDDNSDDGGD